MLYDQGTQYQLKNFLTCKIYWNNLKFMKEEIVVAYLNVLFWHPFGRANESHEKLSRVSGPRG